MKTNIAIIATSLILGTTISLIAQHQNTALKQLQANPKATTQDAIIAKLEEIVQIREKTLKSNEPLILAGRLASNTAAEIELFEARFDLARERGHKEEVIKEFSNLISAYQQQLKRLQNAGNEINPSQIDQAKALLLHTEVRLLREQKDTSQ